MAYWVYENGVLRYASVHIGSCGYCKDGIGVRKARKLDINKWHGPFETSEGAVNFANQTRREVRIHSCLENPTEPVRAGTYHRFELPDVDESTLSLADLFDRRMKQIYVSMREEMGYSPRRFLHSVRTHGGVEHAKRSLRRNPATQAGFQLLKDTNQKIRSMEAHIVDPQFAPLFTEWEIAEARRRLGQA